MNKIFLGLLFLLFDETSAGDDLLTLLPSLLGGILLLRGGKAEKLRADKSVLLARAAGVFLFFIVLSAIYQLTVPLIQNEIRRRLFHFILSAVLFVADAAIFWAAAETAAEVSSPSGILLTFGYSCGFLRLLSALTFPFPKLKLLFKVLSVITGAVFLFFVGRYIRKEQETSHQAEL